MKPKEKPRKTGSSLMDALGLGKKDKSEVTPRADGHQQPRDRSRGHQHPAQHRLCPWQIAEHGR